MYFHLMFKNGDQEAIEAPCFGLTGRVDWNGCNPSLYEEIDDWSDNRRLGRPKEDDWEEGPALSQWLNEGEESIVAITLKLDETFRNLFHVRMLPVWEYLINESIWSPLFNQTAEEIIQSNTVNFLVDTVVPSEIQTSLHVWCRDVLTLPNFAETFVMLAPYVGRHLAFGVSLCFPHLNTGSTSCTSGSEGISGALSLDFWREPSIDKLDAYPHNMKAVMGYVMNVTRVWRTPEGTELTCSTMAHKLQAFAGTHKMRGLFGTFTFQGLDNPVRYVKEILGV